MTAVPKPVASIGQARPLVDGPEKVTGRAKYAADYRSAGALVGRILRSPVAHARVIGLDTAAAEALPGVEAVGLIDNLHLNSLSTNTTSVNADGVEPPPGRRAHGLFRLRR